jgi:beta-1,4-mannosyltransferase
VKVPELEDVTMDLDRCLKSRLFFRIVTRGNNPNLVLNNVIAAVEVLRKTPLPASQWVVEVATDNPLHLNERSDVPVTELLVPTDYVCPNGAKYKARALEYAVKISEATRDDWVIHLDEETRIEEETVKYIYAHCAEQEADVLAGKKTYGNIGQGVILYGTAKYPDNYLTTLADSIRVSDDFGKFRLQYEIGEPLIGMHGSFVVCQTAVEEDVSFDHGLAGSITEDAYFALAARGFGVKFSWIDAFMYEQSPFTVLDFIKQRARWFGGLWLVVLCRGLPCSKRLTLALMTCSWLCSPIVLIAMTLSMIVTTEKMAENVAIIVFVGAASCWGYLLGFVWTFKLSDGWARYFFLFFAQLALQPIFAVMETAGIVYAVIFPPVKGFYIVQKEGGVNNSEAVELDGAGFSSGSSENNSDESGDTSTGSIEIGKDDEKSLISAIDEAQKDNLYFLRPDFLRVGSKLVQSDHDLHLRKYPEF